MRKTKIICTLGPSTEDPQVLKQLMLEGMNAARFNFPTLIMLAIKKILIRLLSLGSN